MKPGLRRDEEEVEGVDDLRPPPAALFQLGHEQRPGVLEVGDRHHADDAGGQL
jgi:hypothetical protein